jgi:hypothetical protein
MTLRQLLVLLLVSFVIVTALVFVSSGKSKRHAPVKVIPIHIGTTEYRVPNTIRTEGVVEAWDLRANKLVWRKRVYRSLKLPFLEDQFNFIVSVTNGPAKGEITILNERGKSYILDVTTQKVRIK